jgi:glycine amidinotransferase
MVELVNSWNEWDPLKRVIVGRPDFTLIPAPEPAIEYDVPACPYPDYGSLPSEKVDRAREQMDAFVAVLEKNGVTVDRPTPINFDQRVMTPDWIQQSMRGCMPPRDLLLAIGNEILEATMSERARWFEYLCYRPILEEYFHKSPEFIWEAAPKPRLTDDSYEKGYWENYRETWSYEKKIERALQRKWTLTQKEPLFDAADIARCGKDIFIQASSKTNAAGISWVRRHFEPKGFRVHEVQFGGNPRLWHIDANYLPLCPGKAIINPDWPPITREFVELHRINGWELIEAAPPTRTSADPWSYIDDPTGRRLWLSINTLMLNPGTIFVEAQETAHQELLHKLGFELIILPFDELGAFGGSFHCATVDVCRAGACEDYFPKQLPGY